MSFFDQKVIAVEYSGLADIRREDQFESFIPAQDDYYDGEPPVPCMLTNVDMCSNVL